MRILFLKDDPYPPDLHAGVELNTHFLALRLKARGYTVAVGALRAGAGEIAEDDVCGYPVYRGERLTSLAWHARRRFIPHVMVNQNRTLWPFLLPKPQDRGGSTVFYEHSVLPDARLPPVELRRTALLAVNSAVLARHFRTRFGIGSVVVPPLFGVDRHANAPRTPRHVLMVSVQRRKGADLALRLAARRPDVPFVFVESWSEDAAETAELKRQLGALGNVNLLSNQPDIGGVLATTRLLLMPSRSPEAWGRMVTECQLAGIPVLGSRRGSLETTIGPGGIALDPDDEFHLWAEAFDRLWDDAGHLDRLGSLAREHAQKLMHEVGPAIQRFEMLLHAARPDLWPMRGRIVTLERHAVAARPVDRADLRLMRKLQTLIGEVAATDQRLLPQLAKKQAAPPSPSTMRRIAKLIGLPLGPEVTEVATLAAANREEVVLQCLKGMSPAGWSPAITLEGQQHLDEALAAGNGAVLWVVHMVFATNVVKMALHRAGYRLTQLSRPEHGMSKTLFGMRHLNRIRTDFEDRFLVKRIRFERAHPAAAMLEARAVLRRNELLSVTAGAWEGSRMLEQPFLAGRLRLATGALRLAQLTGAALLPVSGVRHDERFVVQVEPPIQLPKGGPEDDILRKGFAQYVAYIAQNVIRRPAQWRGWSALVD